MSDCQAGIRTPFPGMLCRRLMDPGRVWGCGPGFLAVGAVLPVCWRCGLPSVDSAASWQGAIGWVWGCWAARVGGCWPIERMLQPVMGLSHCGGIAGWCRRRGACWVWGGGGCRVSTACRHVGVWPGQGRVDGSGLVVYVGGVDNLIRSARSLLSAIPLLWRSPVDLACQVMCG